ncbi:MAG: hypothetical protein FWE98_02690 [Oscillospiraceae bacterium]|nr:hypothetical protein [Oscillospiraceae bacterium]
MDQLLDNAAVRAWYREKLESIPEQIDSSLSLEEQARRAHELRNQYRTQARALMADEDARAELERTQPNVDFEAFLANAMEEKQLNRMQALAYIIGSATRSNKRIDEQLRILRRKP